MNLTIIVAVALVIATIGVPAGAAAHGAREQYTAALARERTLRSADRPASLRSIRQVVASYEQLVRSYPGSGYSDNALWQAGNLALLAYQQFAQAADRRTGVRVLNQLKTSYPSSSLLERFDETIAEFDDLPQASPPARTPAAAAPPSAPRTATAKPALPAPTEPRSNLATDSAPALETVTIRGITRTPLPDGVRVSIEMDGESAFHQEQLESPRRVFFDVKNARPAASLADGTLRYQEALVSEIRLGRRPQNTTRIVMNMNGAEGYSVFTLYNPYRVVVDFRRSVVAADSAPNLERPTNVASRVAAVAPAAKPASAPAAAAGPIDKIPLPSRQAVAPELAAPSVPATNSTGKFSIARQLGLGISRIVIDAGHGGHDPGAHGSGLNESDLVLDVAQRLRTLLEAQPGMEVVMTRDTDVFIPLEERTAIANREGADLFLSIHANASRNTKARGIETYFLNFASNPEAAAVAARENSASAKTMHSLPEIVRAITLNNKIDESRDFADLIQKSMVRKLTAKNAEVKDLGVKQAPFVVLIGAGMPSVLAEISFVTHRQEGALLKTNAYRQQIADALHDAVLGYQKSLKSRSAVATREE